VSAPDPLEALPVGEPPAGPAVGVTALRGMPDAQRRLALLRSEARQVFLYRLVAGDVLFTPSGPLQLLEELVRVRGFGDEPRVRLVVKDYYPTGEPYVRDFTLPMMRQVLAWRG